MKTEFLKGLGLEQDVVDKIMAENEKDIAAEKAKTAKAESERDNFKDQLATATESLEKFKDVDPAAMQGEIDKLNQQLKDKDAEYAAKEADRIFSDTIKEAIKTAGGRNERAVMAMLDMDALKASKNQSEDIKKALETVKESDASKIISPDVNQDADAWKFGYRTVGIVEAYDNKKDGIYVHTVGE